MKNPLKNKKIVFLDLDGTIYLGNELIKGAKKFLNDLESAGIKYYFLSNNSSRS
ncbi:MAG: HAD-IIA family hydrolase, partial [Acidobacteriota bacterium]